MPLKKSGSIHEYPVAIISDRALLTKQAIAHAASMQMSLDELTINQLVDWLSSHSSSTVLLYLSDEKFAFVADLCRKSNISTQRHLFRLVDRIDQQDGVQIGTVCPQAEIPVFDDAWRSLLKRLSPKRQQGRDARNGPETLDFSDRLYDDARQLARKPIDILLRGETGCGKDKLARFIHEQSNRKGPFIAINCAALPESLAESELFGSEAGAYTGAKGERIGRLEAAHGGTLYLDEIDSCPAWLQPKLLRALQEKGVERLGSSQFRPCDFRLIASTKVQLTELVSQGAFRSDLYFRLGAVELELPPLREDPQRILRLFDAAVADAAQRLGMDAPTVSAEVEGQLLTHAWPGNIRELRAAATRHVLGFSALPQDGDGTRRTLKDVMDACERSLLVSALQRRNGCVSSVSRELSVSLNTLYYRLKRLGIAPRRVGAFMVGAQAFSSE